MTLHSADGVDASIPLSLWRTEEREGGATRFIKPSADIKRVESDQFVETCTWWPGAPPIINDLVIFQNGMMEVPGVRALNLYRPPPAPRHGEAAKAAPWVSHVKQLFPDPEEHEYFFSYCAHTVQHPEVKINAAVIMAGSPKIGKDSLLYPMRTAVGEWNVNEIEPDMLFSQYRPWVESLLLVVNEARPTKDDFHATTMYNVLKPLAAAPPDWLPLNDKYRALRYVRNHMRVIVTTNEWLSLYVPADDRRFFIMLSPMCKDWHISAGQPGYFDALWGWMTNSGGAQHVAAWLRARDLSKFDPKREPPRTAGWHEVVASWHSHEDLVEDALAELEYPEVVMGYDLLTTKVAQGLDTAEELRNLLKSSRKITHRMERYGYQLIRRTDGVREWRTPSGRRSKLAFIKRELRLLPDDAYLLVNSHIAKDVKTS